MKEVLEKIIQNSRWTYPAFDGKIIIEGRILSPSESEVCGLSSALIAKSILSEDNLRRLSNINEDEIVNNKDDFDSIIKILKDFKPDKILQLSLSQDKILERCVMRASSDKGVSWQNFKLVIEENKQSVKHNFLWIGLLTDKDRKNMLDLCLEGHKKASAHIRGSL